MSVTKCGVGDFDWLALGRLDPPLHRLNGRVETVEEAILNHLGAENIFSLSF